jgi:3',5'-cyclic AMP phosphodiesterase CpdA
MPISLPSLSRRRFLAGSAAAGLGLLADSVRAQVFGAGVISAYADPNRLALLSDTHVADSLAASSRGVTMANNLWQVTRDVLALRDKPAHVLINGDLAHLHGRATDYTMAVSLLAPLRQAGMPIHVALGNHDSREHLATALPALGIAAPAPASRQVTVIELPRANVLMLDSLNRTNQMRGSLGEAQLDWLAKALDARPKKPALVFVHHHPELGFNLIRGGIADTAALMGVLSPRRQVKALVYGHTHVWSHRQQPDGLHLVNLPSTAYVFSGRQPNGWVDAQLQATGARLQLHTLDPRHPLQGQQLSLAWRA